MGAEVTAVDSTYKQDIPKRFGADHLIDYTKADFTASGRKYDVIFDMVPSSSYGGCVKALNPQGRYVLGNPWLSDMLRSVFTTRLTSKIVLFASARETKEELVALKEMIERGEIHSIVDRIFPLADVAQAHRLVEAEQRVGALVLSIGDVR